jgi:hypothetical protein
VATRSALSAEVDDFASGHILMIVHMRRTPPRSVKMTRFSSLRRSTFAVALLLSVSATHAQTTFALDCTPDLISSARDNDPVVSVAVSINGVQWRVMHIAASGKRYDRSEQYDLHDLPDQRAGTRSWQGTLINRPYRKMVGQIHPAGDNFTYVETLYDARKSGAKTMELKFGCVSVGANQRFQPPQLQVTQEPPQVADLSNIHDPSEVRISISNVTSNPPVITGTTNLPDGTSLGDGQYLRGDFPKCAPRCGFALSGGTVEHGKFEIAVKFRDGESFVPPDFYTVDIIVNTPAPLHSITAWGSNNLVKYTFRILAGPTFSSILPDSGRFVSAVDPDYDADEIRHGHSEIEGMVSDNDAASLQLSIPDDVKRHFIYCLTYTSRRISFEGPVTAERVTELLSMCPKSMISEYCRSQEGRACELLFYSLAKDALESCNGALSKDYVKWCE